MRAPLERIEPSALDMMRMMYVSLGDLLPAVCDAHLVHGAPATEEHHYRRLLREVADHYRMGAVGGVVINGLSVDECKRQNQAYCGFEIYQDILINFGIPEKRIELLPPSRHTGAELCNFLDMARIRKWQNLIISSLPHHQLRCFLQIVALLEHPYWFKVYNMTVGGISLMSTISKPAWIDLGWPSVLRRSLSISKRSSKGFSGTRKSRDLSMVCRNLYGKRRSLKALRMSVGATVDKTSKKSCIMRRAGKAARPPESQTQRQRIDLVLVRSMQVLFAIIAPAGRTLNSSPIFRPNA